jgi:hypothetical protein
MRERLGNMFDNQQPEDSSLDESEIIANDLRSLYVDQALYEPDSRRRKSTYLSFLAPKTSNRNSK